MGIAVRCDARSSVGPQGHWSAQGRRTESPAARQRLVGLGRLAGGIAHDFNNLLEVILSYSSLVADELEDRPGVREDVREIERAAQRAVALTGRLLRLDRTPGAPGQPVNLSDVVRDLEPWLTRTLGEDVAVVTRLHPELWNLHGDAGRLEQVLVNLALNARDAMPEGGRLEIATENVSDARPGADHAQDRITLTVTDTGTGMSEAVAACAFEPFFTTKPAGKGTGLGLASVEDIVEECRGEIELATAPGMGTSFILHFPATPDPVQECLAGARA